MSRQTRHGPGSIGKRRKTDRKMPLPQAISFCRKFVRSDAVQYFIQAWEPILVAWASLLHVTTLPSNNPITTLNLTAAVQAIDSVIAGKFGTELPSRFGYVQLFNFLETLSRRIQSDKDRGAIPSEPSRINAARAYDIYRNAQCVASGKDTLRHLKQIGSRWKHLIGSSTLLLAIFSETAESFAYMPS